MIMHRGLLVLSILAAAQPAIAVEEAPKHLCFEDRSAWTAAQYIAALGALPKEDAYRLQTEDEKKRVITAGSDWYCGNLRFPISDQPKEPNGQYCAPAMVNNRVRQFCVDRRKERNKSAERYAKGLIDGLKKIKGKRGEMKATSLPFELGNAAVDVKDKRYPGRIQLTTAYKRFKTEFERDFGGKDLRANGLDDENRIAEAGGAVDAVFDVLITEWGAGEPSTRSIFERCKGSFLPTAETEKECEERLRAGARTAASTDGSSKAKKKSVSGLGAPNGLPSGFSGFGGGKKSGTSDVRDEESTCDEAVAAYLKCKDKKDVCCRDVPSECRKDTGCPARRAAPNEI